MSQKKILYYADNEVALDFQSRSFPEDCLIIRINELHDLQNHPDVWVCFILNEEILTKLNNHLIDSGGLVFISGVENTLKDGLLNFPHVRVNAWPGFFQNPLLELSAPEILHTRISEAMQHLGWNYRLVADIPGLITPRVIAMIVNEACYAVEEHVSTKEEIDTAMKLGTNYPYGPFEWSKRIGAKKIISLLKKLSANDPRYLPAPDIENLLNES